MCVFSRLCAVYCEAKAPTRPEGSSYVCDLLTLQNPENRLLHRQEIPRRHVSRNGKYRGGNRREETPPSLSLYLSFSRRILLPKRDPGVTRRRAREKGSTVMSTLFAYVRTRPRIGASLSSRMPQRPPFGGLGRPDSAFPTECAICPADARVPGES